QTEAARIGARGETIYAKWATAGVRHAIRCDDRGAGRRQLGALAPLHRPGRGARLRIALALRPLLLPPRATRAGCAGDLGRAHRHSVAQLAAALRSTRLLHDVPPPS